MRPAGDIEELATYNRTFTESSHTSDTAWASMFPRKLREPTQHRRKLIK